METLGGGGEGSITIPHGGESFPSKRDSRYGNRVKATSWKRWRTGDGGRRGGKSAVAPLPLSLSLSVRTDSCKLKLCEVRKRVRNDEG